MHERRSLEVRETRIVRALARASTRRHLTPFFRRATTTSEAGREAGESLRTFSNKTCRRHGLRSLRSLDRASSASSGQRAPAFVQRARRG